MEAGVSTACLYPEAVEEALYKLAVSGVPGVEIFFNSFSETNRAFVSNLRAIMDRFDMKCFSVHPFMSELETLMFFSNYGRRTRDSLDVYKRYFDAMNILGARYFVFHGNRLNASESVKFYCDRFMQLCETGKSFGVTVVQENVVRCESASLGFLSKMQSILGEELRLCLDIKQAVRSKENPMTAAERLGANIDLVHISDHGEYGDCLQIGKGRFNVKAFLSKIGEKNPDAKIILELYRSSFDSASDLYTNYSRLSSYIQGLAC